MMPNTPKTLTPFICLLLAFTLLLSPVHAQQAVTTADYPTLQALQTTTLPAADFVELAERLRGVNPGSLPTPRANPPARQIGERQVFWVLNSVENKNFQTPATLRVVGKHIYMWVQEGVEMDTARLQRLAAAFDIRIYQPVRDLWGDEASPGIDGDRRIYVLFAHGLGGSVGAYFASRHVYPAAVFPTSNQHEMFFFNLDAINPAGVDTPGVESILAHEFQHMIRANHYLNMDIWLNEGLSTFTQWRLYGDPGGIYEFLLTPATQVNTWAEDYAARTAHYGAAVLFIGYFYERYGLDALKAVSQDTTRRGLGAFDHVLKTMGKPGVNEFFADWVLANYLLDSSIEDGRYGYRTLAAGTPSAAPLATVTAYPYTFNGLANPYVADYHVFNSVNGARTLDVKLTMPRTTQLIPAAAPSGRWLWYSNRGDMSNTSLTRAFDLTGVRQATLNYKVWYHLEKFWDYGYVMVSTDDGKTWGPLSTPHTTAENPQSTAYGPGYTGQGDGWLTESLSLDQYAGKKIQVRFEVITDDAVNQPGMALDAVSIPEIGYQSDFETDDGGWTAQGWMRIDNVLPGQAWVQAVQRIGKQIKLTRWLATGDAAWTLPLETDVEQVVLVVSPFAPVTTVPVPYTLAVNAVK
jgi:hypothetical protein